MVLHGGVTGPILLAWEFEPYLLFGLIFAAGLYYMGLRAIASRGDRTVPPAYPIYFYGGLLTMAVAVAGPVETYNDNSFALHMGQHVLLMLVAAPLIVLGRPVHIALWALRPTQSGALLRPILRRGWVRTLLNVITHPVAVLVLINVNLILWHLPRFYIAALENWVIHELEHLLFLGTALLFWWIIIDPVPRHHRVRVDIGIVLLFVTGTVGDLLALYLIFAPDVIYPFYLASETVLGVSALADQKIAGLVMLVTGTAVYFGATFMLIARSHGKTTEAGSSAADAPIARHVSEPV